MSSPPPARRSRRRVQRPTVGHAFLAALLSAIVPGLGQLYAREKRKAYVFLAISGVSMAVAAYFLLGYLLQGKVFVLKLWVQPGWVMALIIAVVVLLAFRLYAIFDAFRSVRPVRPRTTGATLTVVLLLATVLIVNAVPHWWAYDIARAEYDLLTSDVFADDEPVAPGTTSTSTTAAGGTTEPGTDPATSSTATTTSTTTTTIAAPPLWEPGQRVNILLMGGDAGVGRTSVRTDTMMVFSIDPETGYSALMAVPRNLANIPFPAGPAADANPDGFGDIANAIYRYGLENPDLFPGASDTGAAAIKGALGELMGITIHYYALVNLESFVEMIDALGGVTMYVPEAVHDDAYPHEDGSTEVIDIPVGVHEFDGHMALAYARSRRESDDYNRMNRQRCVLEAMAEAADPVTLLRAFPDLVPVIKENVSTDIPVSRLPDLIEVADKVDTEQIVSVRFIPERFISGRNANRFPIPNVPLIRETVQTIFSLPPAEAIEVLDLQSLDDACPSLEDATGGTG